MILANNKVVDIPKEWQHKKDLRNAYGDTVAMILASKNIIDIPDYWCHDNMLKNNKGETVSMIYKKQHIQYNDYWKIPILK